MSIHTHTSALSTASTATPTVAYKGMALIAAQVMAFLGLIFLLHNVAPAMGGMGLFFEIAGMAFAGMCAAVICYHGVMGLSVLIKRWLIK